MLVRPRNFQFLRLVIVIRSEFVIDVMLSSVRTVVEPNSMLSYNNNNNNDDDDDNNDDNNNNNNNYK